MQSSIDDATWHDLEMNDLFDRLDNNITPIGRQYLYRQLRCYELDENKLVQQHLTSKHFVADNDLREQVQLRLMSLRSANGSLVTSLLFDELPEGNFPKKATWLLAGTSLMAIAIAVISPSLFWLPLISLLVNFIFTSKHEDTFGRHSVSFGYLRTLLKVARLLPGAGSHSTIPQLEFLKENHSSISNHKSYFLVSGFDGTSSNVIVAQLAHYLNLIFLFDFLIFIRYTQYIKRHKAQLIDIFYAVASLDSAISVASYLSSNNDLCNPQFNADNAPAQHEMRFTDVTHPLLENAIPNNYLTYARSALITGSNMAGKSTFIKTVGINLILAQTLYICHASAAQVPKLPVLSSIKNSDSLASGKSYYFAEIESLLRLVDIAKTNQPCIFLIDEILHGTNTVERIAGAAAILDFLSMNNTVFVTSHDVELTQLLPDRFKSFHFRETADIDKMFDFKIHHGHCKTRNAITLLEGIGFPSSVIDAARENTLQIERRGNSTTR